ncbi:MAG: hypothetical protein GTO41_17280 [Burkholderiales bacterium]|nr:hypothetical protein [Burkholderiales bacterium]
MRYTKWMVLFLIGVMSSSAGLADDANHTSDIFRPAANQSLADLLAESTYMPRWQLYRPVEATSYSERLLQPIADVEFHDNSALGTREQAA